MKLSKEDLSGYHFSLDQISTLYRGLYVHSFGYFNQITSFFSQVTDKFQRQKMIHTTWKVFAYLLEHSGNENLSMIIQ